MQPHLDKNIRTVIVGNSESDLMVKISTHTDFLGIVEEQRTVSKHDKIFGGMTELKKAILEGRVDEVFWNLSNTHDSLKSYYKSLCESHMVRMYIVDEDKSEVNSLILKKEPLHKTHNLIIKRTFDIIVSLLVIVFILSWVLPIAAILIKLTSKGPIFFLQDRTGIDGVPFKILKLRTMYVNDDSDKVSCQKNDSRITSVGNFLRKTYIDEMPQFFHALSGKMSVVGPRPHMISHTKEFGETLSSFMVRHYVKPGLTGWAQVNGSHGSMETTKDMEKRVKLDIWYIENWKFYLDFIICFKTFLMIFKKS